MGQQQNEYRFSATVCLKVLRYDEYHKPIFSDKHPSEDFLAAMRYGGPDSHDCEFCGRFHASQEYQGPKNGGISEKIFRHDYSSLSTGLLDNKVFVFDCPCNAAIFYEKLFWQHLPIIAPYSRARAIRKFTAAQQKLELAESVVVPG
jgi:hypothetical protein